MSGDGGKPERHEAKRLSDGGARRGQARVPWAEIRAQYIADPTCSLRSLARQYGPNVTTISRRAKKEKWNELRAAQAAKSDVAQQKATDDLRARAKEQAMRALADVEATRKALTGKMRDHMQTATPPDIVEDTVVHEEEIPAGVSSDGVGGNNPTTVKKGVKRKKLATDSRSVRAVFEFEFRLLSMFINPPRSATTPGEIERVIEID